MKIRQRRAPAALEPSLDFTPVVLDKPRADGWTPERQRGFVYALADLGSVRAACATVGMASVGAYALRRRKDAESFARAWARAQAAGVKALRDIAYERAVDGTPRGIWYQGERVGEERRYNDRLLMFMLRHEQPSSYGAPKRLPRGTRHPDTVAREARWAAEDAEDAVFEEVAPEAEPVGAEDVAKAEARDETIREVCAMYHGKILAERTARLAGDIVDADHALRQATLLEVLITVNGSGELIANMWPGLFDGGPGGHPVVSTPMSALFEEVRRKAWAEAGDPPRPDTLPRNPPLSCHQWGGPTATAREYAYREAKTMIAQGQALWEAAGNEERWAAWGERGYNLSG